jgi:predicted transcriptional regulator
MSNTTYKNNKINLNQEKIIQLVNNYPGIRYRELLRITGLANGTLSRNLKMLSNSNKIKIHHFNNRLTRYFSHNVSTSESKVIGLLRQNTSRKVIICILEYEPCRFNDIVKYIHKASSTVSWHLSRLKDANIIKIYRKNDIIFYKIKINKLKLQNLLNKYKSGFKR